MPSDFAHAVSCAGCSLRIVAVIERVVAEYRGADGREVELAAVARRDDADGVGVADIERCGDGHLLHRRECRPEHEAQLFGIDRQHQRVVVDDGRERRRDLRGRERDARGSGRDDEVARQQRSGAYGGGVDGGLIDLGRHVADRQVEVAAGAARQHGAQALFGLGA